MRPPTVQKDRRRCLHQRRQTTAAPGFSSTASNGTTCVSLCRDFTDRMAAPLQGAYQPKRFQNSFPAPLFKNRRQV